jgi:Na+/phosphate symporter
MEEDELVQRFYKTFEALMPILQDVYKGFFSNNTALLKECLSKFQKMHAAVLPFIEKVFSEKDKDPVEKKYVALVLSFQPIALAIDNLINRMLEKVQSNVLFGDKAVKEIKTLLDITYGQCRDAKDYFLTKNPHLRHNVVMAKEKLMELVIEYDIIHQNRLITGVCMPKASYMYIDFTHSLKRLSKGLADLVEEA